MKSVKGGKGGNNKQQQKSTESSDSPAALFPRLHVRETKNVGPRAPPRNKMALYEELTIPSHRFHQQQERASTPSSVRPTAPAAFMAPQSYPAGYYMPCYIAPPMPFQQMPMMGNNGDMEEHQRVPGLSLGDDTGQLQRLASCQSNTSTLKVTSSKNSRESQEDFTVPTYQSAMTTKPLQAGKAAASTTVEDSRQARELAAVSSEGQSARTFDSRRSSARPAGYQNTLASHSRSTIFVTSDRRQGESKQPQVEQSPTNSENNGDLDNPSDEEQSGQSRPGNSEMSEGSDASALVDGIIPKVSSKDVMDVVGERHFWEMRKAIQRQQRLFRSQLFELHRVTKVQHLIASSGNSSPDDDTDVPSGKMLPAPAAASIPQEAAKTIPEPKQPPPSQPLTASATVPVAPTKPVKNYSAPALPPAPPPYAPQEYPSYPAPYFLPGTSGGYPAFGTNSVYPAPGTNGVCPAPGTNGGYPAPYVGFSNNQWFTQVPVTYPYHQPFAAPVGVYNSPYGPVFTGQSPIPFVPYTVPGYERDPRLNMAASHAAAAGVPSFSNGAQWINYPRPFTNSASSSFGSTHQQTSAAAPAAPAAPAVLAAAPTRKEQSNNNNKNNRSYSKLIRTDTGSSTGFNLIQRAEAGSSTNTGNAPKSMEVEKQSQQQSQLEEPQPQQPQPQQSSTNPALYSYFFSSVESERRPQQVQLQQKVTKVAPKASLVTPESAAGILQSLRRQER